MFPYEESEVFFMKKCNKIIAVILSVVMFIGILPMADIAKLDFSFPFKAYAADVVSSGSCGDNLTWELNDEGVLTISGTGKMKNYSSDSNQPWASYRDQITSVEFPDGLTTIGNYAFRLAENLTEVTLPDSVVSIGDHAFNRCYALETVELNDGL